MYSVKIRDSVMIAHSLDNPVFGPAQNLHGATFIVDVEFVASSLNQHNVVIDICDAREIVNRVLEKLNYRNLDDVAEFDGVITTAEFIARYIHDRVCAELAEGFAGHIRIEIQETHDAWVSYDGVAGEPMK
jgi:6-pyruvoyltetrahydropterin/6-carboxytetrahydropterin synthase